MKTKLIFGLLLLSVFFSQAIAMAPGSSDLFGAEKNNFTTNTPVYLTHSASVICGDDTLKTKNVTAYILHDNATWAANTNLSATAVATGIVTIGLNSKISSTMIWENPQAGNWDVILDLNDNGLYDQTCPDMLDDLTPAGFIVTLAAAPSQNTTSNATTNNTLVNNTTVTPTVNKTGNATTAAPAAEKAASGTQDYTPIIILSIAIIIAVVIVIWTIRTMR